MSGFVRLKTCLAFDRTGQVGTTPITSKTQTSLHFTNAYHTSSFDHLLSAGAAGAGATGVAGFWEAPVAGLRLSRRLWSSFSRFCRHT